MTPGIGDFLTRLVRLDPAAVVRVRTGEVWARVPWNVLVTRTVSGLSADTTVRASAWLSLGGDDPSSLPRLDGEWRTSLPSAAFETIETVPSDVLRRLSAAAAATLRETATGGLNGRAVGSRVIRDALLDHVPIVVTSGDHEVRVPQRLVQAVTRMGLLGADNVPTDIVAAGPWIGLAAAHGHAWWRPASTLSLRPHRA